MHVQSKYAYRCLCTYLISFVITLLHKVNIRLCQLAEESVSVKIVLKYMKYKPRLNTLFLLEPFFDAMNTRI
jgi:hypothetical protein